MSVKYELLEDTTSCTLPTLLPSLTHGDPVIGELIVIRLNEASSARHWLTTGALVYQANDRRPGLRSVRIAESRIAS
jgi:hypothetical protein